MKYIAQHLFQKSTQFIGLNINNIILYYTLIKSK